MIRYNCFPDARVRCAFTTREGGVSPFPRDSMNMSFKREPVRENVLENYRRAARGLGVDFTRMTAVPQVHGAGVLQVDASLAGIGISRKLPPEILDHGYDAMITDVPGITLCTVHADCTPVFLFDPRHGVIGAVHSGWRGTVLCVVSAAISAMQYAYDSDPEDILALVGPTIGMRAFEIGEDVYREFRDTFGTLVENPALCTRTEPKAGNDTWHLNLPGFVQVSLLASGVLPQHLHRDARCTFEESNLFFSHRRDRQHAGAMAAMIELKAGPDANPGAGRHDGPDGESGL